MFESYANGKGGSGRGLAPTRGRITLHMTHIFMYWPECFGAHAFHLYYIVLQYIAIAMYLLYVLCVCVGFETTTRVLNVGAGIQWKMHGFKRFNHHFAQRKVTWPYARVPRRLGAGGTLTILRFAPLARLRPVPGFYALKSV
jgi:hypothetical protein